MKLRWLLPLLLACLLGWTTPVHGQVVYGDSIAFNSGTEDFSASGTPEGNQAASPGSIYRRTDTGAIYFKLTGTGNTGWVQIPTTPGSVTSVGLSLPSIFTVSGSPVTTAGTLTATLATQAANTLFSGPTAGGAATPAFRTMVLADIPDGLITNAKVNASAAIDWTKISKTGSSLANLATRSAADLSSGILPDARMPALTGDVTTSVGAVATTIANDVVTLAKLANIATLSVIGRSTASSGDPEVLTAGTDHFVLRRSGTTLGFGLLTSANLNLTTTTCTNQFVTAISAGGVGTCTTATLASAQFANQGTATTVLHGNASGNPTWSAVSLTTDVSGILPIASGGTNKNSWTSGSVAFFDGTRLQENNANFFWDASNARLGLATTTPIGRLHAVGDSSNVPGIFQRDDTTTTTSTGIPTVNIENWDVTTDNFSQIGFVTKDSVGTRRPGAAIKSVFTARTSGTVTAAITFNVNAGTGSTLTERGRFTPSGGLNIGASTDIAAGVVNANTGYRIAGAAAIGTFPRGDGTNFIGSTLVLPNAATANQVCFASATNTIACGDADFTFLTDTATITKIVGVTSITNSALTATRVVFSGTAGLQADDADLTFATDTLSATKVAMSSLTSGRVSFSSTAGLQVDDADLTFATDTLTATKVLAPTSVSTPSLISTAAVTVTPAAGSNFNVVLSTTGDFCVNTDDLCVDTSTARVGIGTATPQSGLDLKQTVDSFIGGYHLRRASTNDTWSFVTGNDNKFYIGYATDASGANAAADFTIIPMVLATDASVGMGGVTSPSARLHVIGTTEQCRFAYDASNYWRCTVASDGATTFDAVGAGATFTLSDPVTLSQTLAVTGVTTLTGLLNANGGIAVDTDFFTVGDGTGNVNTKGYVGSLGFASQTTGWRATFDGAADFRYIFADEMRVKLFSAEEQAVYRASLMVTKSHSEVSQAFTCPAAGATSTLWVRDAATLADARIFSASDWVVVRVFSRTDTDVDGAHELVIGDCVGQVTSYADGTAGNEGQQSWTFTRGSGGSSGTLTAATVVPVGNAVLDFGVTGNGVVEATAYDGLEGVNSPYIQTKIFTGTAPVAAGFTVTSRTGKLTGITGIADEFGFLGGIYDATAGRWVKASNEGVELHGADLTLYESTTATVCLDHAVPSMAIGSACPTAYGTGTGIWMGNDGGTYKARIGNPSGVRAAWDGTKYTIGDLTAEHVEVTGTNLNFNDGASTLASLTGAVWTLGATTTENVRITSTAVELRDGSTVYTDLTAGVLTLGASADNQITLDTTNGLRMVDESDVVRVQLSPLGVLTLGVTSAEHLLANGTNLQFKDNTTVYVDLTAGVLTVGEAANEHVLVNTSGVALRDGASIYGVFAATTTLGATGEEHLSLTSSGIQFKNAATVNGSLLADIWTLGQTANEHVVIDTAGFKANDGAVNYATFSATSTIGVTSTEHVNITSTSVQIKDGATVYTDLTGGTLLLGAVGAGLENLSLTSTGIQFRENTTVRGELSGDAWTLGTVAASSENVQISASGVNFRENTTVRASLSADEWVIGTVAASSENVQISPSGFNIRENTTVRASVVGDTLTLGTVTAASENVVIDPTNGVRFRTDTAVLAQLTGTTWTIGATTDEHLNLTATSLQMKDGATVYSDLSGGILLLGQVESNVSNTKIGGGALDFRQNTDVYGSLRAMGSIVLDAVSSASNSNAGATTVSWSHTVGAGSDRLLVVDVGMRRGAGETVGTVTAGAQSMTFLDSAVSANGGVERWYLIAPDTGTVTITVTVAGGASDQLSAGARSFSGVHQSTPFGAVSKTSGTSVGTTLSVSVASDIGDVVIGALAKNGPTESLSEDAYQTQDWVRSQNVDLNSASIIGGQRAGDAGATSISYSYVAGGSRAYGLIGTAIKPVTISGTRLTLGQVAKSFTRTDIDATSLRMVGRSAAGVDTTFAALTAAGVLTLGDTANEHTQIDTSGMAVKDGATTYALFAPTSILGAVGAGLENVTLASTGIQFRENTTVRGELSGDAWTLGTVAASAENVQISASGINFRENTTVRASLSGDQWVLGTVAASSENVLIDATLGIQLRENTTVRASLASDTLTLGTVAADSENVIIDPTNGLRFRTNTSVLAQLTGTTWTLGNTSTEHLNLTSTALQFKDGSDVYTDLTAGALTLGKVAASLGNVLIDSTNCVQIRVNTTVRAKIACDGSGYFANTSFAFDASGNVSITGNTTLGGWSVGASSITAGNVVLESTGIIRAGATGFSTGVGWWLDYNAGTPRFRVGDPAGNYLSWDGSILDFEGAIVTVDTIFVNTAVRSLAGDLNVGAASGADTNINAIGGGDVLISAVTPGDIIINTNQFFVDTSANRIGIGTTTPVTLTEMQGGLTTVGAVLTLGTKEPTIVVNDVLGRINFYAPLESDGGDAVLFSASIAAIAENTFSSTVNETSLVFQTGASETATTKMTIKSDGKLFLNSALGTGTGGNYVCIDTTTYELLRSNGSTCTASATRFKNDIQPSSFGLDALSKLQAITFEYKPETHMGVGTHLSLRADDVARAIPVAATFDADGEVFGYDTNAVLAVAVSSINELRAEVEQLRALLAVQRMTDDAVKGAAAPIVESAVKRALRAAFAAAQ